MKQFENIAIVALGHHFDVLHNLLMLLSERHINVLVILDVNVQDLLPTEEYAENISILTCNKKTRPCLIKFRKRLLHCDHVLVLTLDGNFNFFYSLSVHVKVSFVCHNTHFFFNEYSKLVKNEPILDRAKSYLHRFFFNRYKTKILKSFHFIFFLSQASYQYASHRYQSNIKAQMMILPYQYRMKIQQPKGRILAIPGGDNFKYRDYTYLINWLTTATNLHIILLGKSSRNFPEFMKECSHRAPQIKITHYEDYIPQIEYDHMLSLSTCLLSPLRQTVNYRGYCETYGFSKISGSINDAVKFQCPLVLPSFYPVPKHLRTLIHTYSDQASHDRILNQIFAMEKSTKTSGSTREVVSKELLSLFSNNTN